MVFIMNLRNACSFVSGLPIYVRSMSDTTHLRTRCERKSHASLGYYFVVVWLVWNKYWFLSYGTSPWMQCLSVGVTCLSAERSWHGQIPGLLGIYLCSVCNCFHGNVSKYEAGLRYTLDKKLRSEKCVIAINIGLKSSNNLYTCFRRKANQMWPRELNNCKSLGTWVGCLSMLLANLNMLFPVEISALCLVSWRAKSHLLNCVECVCVCACESVCDISANDCYAY